MAGIGRPHPEVSWRRFLAALFFATIVSGFLFLFWMIACNALVDFGRDPNEAKSSLLVIFVLQALPLAMVWFASVLPIFIPFSLPPAFIVGLLLLRLNTRGPAGFLIGGALAGVIGVATTQIFDKAIFELDTPEFPFRNALLPALLAGTGGGLTAWWITFGLVPDRSDRRSDQ